MFSYCKSMEHLDVSNFDTSKVTNMYAMFFDCACAQNLQVSGFDTSNVTKYEFFMNNGYTVGGSPWENLFQ